ncbi:MAG: hypothetical protein WCY41_02920 [Candidatus Micrarchaeia archaeon]
MTNVYIPTKAGELDRLYPDLARAGFGRVPKEIVNPPFDMANYAKARDILQKKTREEGPFLKYLMMRNNGSPKGTGKGDSVPMFLEASENEVRRTFNRIMDSDNEATGVIMQPFVGQRLQLFENYKDERVFAPYVSGIAYTAKATARGNAVIEWVYGHPERAVNGAGHYLAFNKDTLERELKEVQWQFADKEVAALRADHDACGEPRLEMRSFDTPSAGSGMATYADARLLKKVMSSVLMLGDAGALCIEWALTTIGKTTRLFALQVSEAEGMLPGNPAWMHEALGNYQSLVREAVPDCHEGESYDYRRLQRMYANALENPKVIAVSFDAVGEGTRVYDALFWKLDVIDVTRLAKKAVMPAIMAFTSDSPAKAMLVEAQKRECRDSLVELSRGSTHETFRGHARAFALTHDFLAMGTGTIMEHKLREMVEAAGFGWASRIKINGKFAIKVSEKEPFATLEAIRVDGVEYA